MKLARPLVIEAELSDEKKNDKKNAKAEKEKLSKIYEELEVVL